MDTHRRHRRLFLIAALGVVVPSARALGSPAVVVNTASRLAMLAERMGKLHAQVGRDVLTVRSRRALTETSAEVEKGLRDATAAASTFELRENDRLLRVLWNEYRPLALARPTVEGARKLAPRNARELLNFGTDYR